MTTPSATVDAQLAEAKAWLWGDAGRDAAQQLLAKARIRLDAIGGVACYEPDDLVADAFANFWARVRRSGPLEDGDLGGYLYVVMRNLVRAAMRGRPRLEVLTGDGRIDDDRLAVDPDPVADPGDVLAELRTAIESIDAPAWAKAGAITLAVVVAHPEAVPQSHPAPRPVAGATPVEAATWLALWFAGRRDGLFPVDGVDGGTAVRKARSRAGTRIRDVFDMATAIVYADRFAGEARSA